MGRPRLPGEWGGPVKGNSVPFEGLPALGAQHRYPLTRSPSPWWRALHAVQADGYQAHRSRPGRRRHRSPWRGRRGHRRPSASSTAPSSRSQLNLDIVQDGDSVVGIACPTSAMCNWTRWTRCRPARPPSPATPSSGMAGRQPGRAGRLVRRPVGGARGPGWASRASRPWPTRPIRSPRWAGLPWPWRWTARSRTSSDRGPARDPAPARRLGFLKVPPRTSPGDAVSDAIAVPAAVGAVPVVPLDSASGRLLVLGGAEAGVRGLGLHGETGSPSASAVLVGARDALLPRWTWPRQGDDRDRRGRRRLQLRRLFQAAMSSASIRWRGGDGVRRR